VTEGDQAPINICHVIPVLQIYKRTHRLPWVPVLISCGFGTQVRAPIVLCAAYIDLWFWDSDSEPTSVTCASALSHVKTLFTKSFFWVAGIHQDPVACNCHLLRACLVSHPWGKSFSTVVEVVHLHSCIELGWRLGDHCCHTNISIVLSSYCRLLGLKLTKKSSIQVKCFCYWIQLQMFIFLYINNFYIVKVITM
jgi:hypothetical protein